jgi:Flp pilus assembly protein TadD
MSLYAAPSASFEARPADEITLDALLAVPPSLAEAVRANVRLAPDPNRTLTALADFMLKPEGLGLRYRHDATFDVAEAYARREGNCLTFTLMTVALARELGIVAYAQDADAVSWYQEGRSVYRTVHVNAGVRMDGRRFSVDIAAEQAITRQPPRPIDDRRLLAHYFNNRAAEQLAQGDLTSALAQAQRAIKADPRHAAAHSNAGVIHARRGEAFRAEQSYLDALAIEPRHPGALANLADLYAREGRGMMADDVRARLREVEQADPFHHFLLALQREAAGDARGGLAHLQRAIRLHPHDHRFHFAAARAWVNVGRAARAEKSLKRAFALSEGDDRARYEAKLGGLRMPPSRPWFNAR